ncbi:MAG: GNAT family N-acetyltransferase [Saprospiraceae bacterium]|nr:GNAT family N-acetyltransferase [Saprospiraceae bacterium]
MRPLRHNYIAYMLVVNFNSFPILSTERLTLRRILQSDVDDLFVLRRDENIMRYIPRPLAASSEDVIKLIQVIDEGTDNNESINWAITLKKENKLIGTIGFVRMSKENHRAEVGYLLHADYQGKGIMQEALVRVINFGFYDIKLHSIEAVIDPANTASAKLLERNNFIKEAHFKENFFYEGKFLDSIHYGLLTPINR